VLSETPLDSGIDRESGSRDATGWWSELECHWETLFEKPEGFTPSDLDALSDFVLANGQLNSFPYGRQHVQHATSRARCFSLVLPAFRITAKRPEHAGGQRQTKVDDHE
jgi:hypothetical protein